MGDEEPGRQTGKVSVYMSCCHMGGQGLKPKTKMQDFAILPDASYVALCVFPHIEVSGNKTRLMRTL